MQRKSLTPPLYEIDFTAWLDQQAELLRSGDLDRLDVRNIAEELEALGRREKRELRSRLAIILRHLLKTQHQPGMSPVTWSVTLRTQRAAIQLLLEDSPSLRRLVPGFIEKAYPLARRTAAEEMGLPLDVFPVRCPFSAPIVLPAAENN